MFGDAHAIAGYLIGKPIEYILDGKRLYGLSQDNTLLLWDTVG